MTESNRIVELLPEAGRLMTKALGEVLQPFRLTVAQLEILEMLWQHGKVSQAAIIEARGVEAATIGTTLTRLENSGWLVREADPADRRGKIVRPTERAMIERQAIRSAVDALEAKIEVNEDTRWELAKLLIAMRG